MYECILTLTNLSIVFYTGQQQYNANDANKLYSVCQRFSTTLPLPIIV